MSGPTPGPWHVDSHPGLGKIYVSSEGVDHGDICTCWLGEGEANARLIAAAPDLLAALQQFTDMWVKVAMSGDCGFWNPEEDEEMVAARAAIAKATGKPSP